MAATRYRTIVADPPWAYDTFASVWPEKYARSVTRPLPYSGMSVEEIRGLPVSELADPAGSALFLWTTNRFLPDAFSVLAAWGFRYRQTLIWDKPNAAPWGGAIAPNSAEFLLFARRGAWRRRSKLSSSVVRALKGTQRHSQKPEAFLDLVEQVSPGPYLELFARRNRIGWDTWGDESLPHVEVLA